MNQKRHFREANPFSFNATEKCKNNYVFLSAMLMKIISFDEKKCSFAIFMF